MSAPDLNVDEALDFLKRLDAAGPHNLVAMDAASGNITGRTFKPEAWSAIGDWVVRHGRDANLSYSVNRPREGTTGKLSDADIVAMRACFVDIDPDRSIPFAEARPLVEAKARALLRCSTEAILDAFDDRPSLIVDTGGGFQALWLFETPIDATDADAWRAQNAGLVAKLGADKPVKALSQLLRLPGSINFPNEAKRRTGRVPAPARVIEASPRLFSRADMLALAPPARAPAEKPTGEDWQKVLARIDLGAAIGRSGYEELPADLRSRFEAEMRHDSGVLGALWAGGEAGLIGSDTSGSGFSISLAAHLLHAGFSEQDFADLIFVWHHDRAQDVDKLKDGRQIARDWRYAEMNKAAHRPRGRDEFDDTTEGLPVPLAKSKPKLFAVGFDESAELALAEAPPPLIEGLLDQETLAVVYGPSNGGKTFIVMDLAFHIATGRKWYGRDVTPGLVVYVAAEGGRNIHKRLAALKAHYAPTEPVAFALVPCPIDLRTDTADVKALVALVRDVERQHGQKAQLVVVDTLSRALAGGDENASTDMGAFILNVDRLRAEVRATALVIHHTGKNVARGMRGWSGLLGALDTELEVEPAEDKRGGNLVATKQRDMPLGKALGYRLIDVEIGKDATGRSLKSCVVRFVPLDFDEAHPVQVPLSAHGQRMLDALELATEEIRAAKGASPEAVIRVTSAEWEKAFRDIGGTGQRTAIYQIRDELVSGGHVHRPTRGVFEIIAAFEKRE